MFTNFPLYWGLWIFTISSCTEDFEFLQFSTCTGDSGFYQIYFSMYSGTYKPSSLYWNFVFLLISQCIEAFEFLWFSPCAEDFVFFNGISYVLEILRLYKLFSYTGDFELLLISPCTGDYDFSSFPMYWKLCFFTRFPI